MLYELKKNIKWRRNIDNLREVYRPKFDPALQDVFLSKGIVLIHIPKNAGTSVENAIFDYSVKHRTWKDIMDEYPKAWEKCYKIAIIRKPLERYVSAFDYLAKGGRNEIDRRFAKYFIGKKDIDKFTRKLWDDEIFRRRAMSYFHFRRQCEFVSDRNGNIRVDILIPFERMSEALQNIGAINVPLQKHNVTRGKRTSLSHIGKVEKEMIHNLYREDQSMYENVCDHSWSIP